MPRSRPFVCLPILFVLLPTVAPTRAQSIGREPLAVEYRGGRGATIQLNRVPLVRATSVQLYAPGWTHGYYSSNGAPPKVDPTTGGDGVLVARHRSERIAFEATETYRFVSDTRLEVTLAGTLTSDEDVRIEWGIGYLNAFALYGGSYAAGADAAPTVVRPEPPAARDNATVVTRAPNIRFDTRVGRVDVTVEAGDFGLNLIDGRRVPERSWTQDTPTFFLGASDIAIKPNEPFELRVSIEVEPAAVAAAEATRIDARPIPVERAFVPQAKPIQIIPKPRDVTWDDGPGYALGPATVLILEDARQRRAAEVIQREAAGRFGWGWKIVDHRDVGRDVPPGAIRLQFNMSHRAMERDEYTIRATPDALTLSAQHPAGQFYAAQTLVQLFQPAAGGVTVPACSIQDGPSLAFRGVHLFPGKGALPLHRKLVERVFARHKINHVVLECSYSQWDTDKGLWVDFSVPKAELAEYATMLRDNFIEPIPLVQSLGHSEWMFKNGRNTDLAEDPETPYAYDVSNPKTYEFIGGVYREALDVFKPKYFHIGHDEVTMRGRYPHREPNKNKSVTDLFLGDVRWMHDLFKARDVRMMLWGDMLLAPGEANDTATFAKTGEDAAARRAGVPTDAIVCDWHYQPAKPEAYKSLKVLKEAGLTPIACTWYTPENIKGFADAARLYGAWGLLQTTWAGYSITDATLAREARQFSAYLLAAEYAWSADSPGPRELPWDADETFARLMKDPSPQPLTPRRGAQLDLSGAATVPLDGDVLQLGALPEEWRFDGVAFRRPAEGVVALAGPLLPADAKRVSKITIDCDVTAAELAFLQATAFPAQPNDLVGTIDVAYADGTTASVELRYARNTRAWTDRGPAPDAALAWSGKTPDRLPASVRLLRWTNPHPQRRLSTITFRTDHPFASPVLLGITALE